MYACMYICVYIYLCMHVYIDICAYIHIYVYIYTHVYIYIYIYIHTRRKCRASRGMSCEQAAHFLQHIWETLWIGDAKKILLPDWKPVGSLFECGAWKKLMDVKLTSKTNK